jgi:ribosomal protein S18 acetylase RimI-like enzyme
MNIELFSIEEYDELTALWDRCGLHYDEKDRDSREKMERQVFDDHVVILTLKTDEGQIVGSVVGSFDGRKAWINRLAVDPDYRARRLAARLVEKVEEMLSEMGARVFAVLIEEENFPSMAAFKYCGYEGWDEIVYFRKKLK